MDDMLAGTGAAPHADQLQHQQSPGPARQQGYYGGGFHGADDGVAEKPLWSPGPAASAELEADAAADLRHQQMTMEHYSAGGGGSQQQAGAHGGDDEGGGGEGGERSDLDDTG
eukprot:SAG22_NODE_7975_length_694_cov_0.547899_1_plen_112_part_10